VKNRSPIILNCFSRGGSNILWNIFLSHPDLCHPLEETLQIFSTNIRAPRYEGFKVAFMEKFSLFDQWNFQDRVLFKPQTGDYIDNILYKRKLNNLIDHEMKYKTENDIYSKSEVEKSRIVLKNNNGLIFLTDAFNEIYSDSTFIGMVRHPIALYESHKRRKTKVAKSIKTFTNYYTCLVKKMLADNQTKSNYHLITFEELLSNPVNLLEKLYNWANIDQTRIKKIRLKAKPFMNHEGRHSTKLIKNKHYWFNLAELTKYLDVNINKNQVSLVSENEKLLMYETLKDYMSIFQYEVY